MVIHDEPSELAGQTVRVADGVSQLGGMGFRVEDWWDRVMGKVMEGMCGQSSVLGMVHDYLMGAYYAGVGMMGGP